MVLRMAAFQPERLVAESLDEAEGMRDQQDRPVAPPELGELVETLVRKALVADGQNLVDEQHIWIHVNCNGKTKAHIHAGRIRLHGRIDEFTQLRKVDDVVEAL